MSRIYDALRQVEGHRPSALKTAEPDLLDLGRPPDAPQFPDALTSLPSEDMPALAPCLRLEELRRRCFKPGWTLGPEFDVFSSQQSSALCAEQIRALRARLYRLREKNPVRTLLVTSTLPGEGKTFVALNLALAVARQHEKRALLIDADLRASQLHVRLGAPSAPGLSDYLNKAADEFSIVQADSKVELFLVPAGRSVSNPSELLANGLMKNFLERVSPVFDWVIVDAPPVLPVADAGILAEYCDGVIVVVHAGKADHDLVKMTVQEFRGKNLLGVVLNGAEEGTNYGKGSYYAGFGTETE